MRSKTWSRSITDFDHESGRTGTGRSFRHRQGTSKTDRQDSKAHHNYHGAPFAREEYEAVRQRVLAVSGISIYGVGLPGPTSYDIVSAASRNLRDR